MTGWRGIVAGLAVGALCGALAASRPEAGTVEVWYDSDGTVVCAADIREAQMVAGWSYKEIVAHGRAPERLCGP